MISHSNTIITADTKKEALQRRSMWCSEEDLLKSWQENHNELNEMKFEWLSASASSYGKRRSLIFCQLPSSRSPRIRSALTHPSPQQGPKGDSPKDWGSKQFAFKLKPSRPNNPILTLSISFISQLSSEWKAKCHGAAITVFSKRKINSRKEQSKNDN